MDILRKQILNCALYLILKRGKKHLSFPLLSKQLTILIRNDSLITFTEGYNKKYHL